MNNKEIIEMNKVIARFMGYEYFPYEGVPNDRTFTSEFFGWRAKDLPNTVLGLAPEHWFLCRKHFELAFHYDWSWLMRVINKIHSIGENDIFCSKHNYHVQITKRFTRVIYDWNKFGSTEDIKDLEGKISRDYRYVLFNESSIKATFQAVYDFIIYYNNLKLK